MAGRTLTSWVEDLLEQNTLTATELREISKQRKGKTT
jgi:hypothetical protein